MGVLCITCWSQQFINDHNNVIYYIIAWSKRGVAMINTWLQYFNLEKSRLGFWMLVPSLFHVAKINKVKSKAIRKFTKSNKSFCCSLNLYWWTQRLNQKLLKDYQFLVQHATCAWVYTSYAMRTVYSRDTFIPSNHNHVHIQDFDISKQKKYITII